MAGSCRRNCLCNGHLVTGMAQKQKSLPSTEWTPTWKEAEQRKWKIIRILWENLAPISKLDEPKKSSSFPQAATSPPQLQGNQHLDSSHHKLVLLFLNSTKWNHTVCNLSSLESFTQHAVYEIFLYVSVVYSQYIFFHSVRELSPWNKMALRTKFPNG